jgi:phage N-6-adenine-methyltransferase
VADGTGPSVKRGRSKQDHGTPREFLDAVEKRFGRIAVDLAAHHENRVVDQYLGPLSGIAEDSLAVDWSELSGVLWLNPEFANIAPWAEKCATHRHRHSPILLLTPASIGTDWFNGYVKGNAIVLGLSPRMTFVGSDDPYPKDLMLSVFYAGLSGFSTWRWK